ncbi:hypothetical protein [Burkholderia stagnalis]|uniref:hypothetical protein n=1 Tax=Burkholderia stagnalis TaxID=1503054 RepID=UPI0007570BC0|nr:hypothetical protein [Burkholderia stagnalis]KVN33069.1 hypothetical protein WT11_16495 [Burkholderia stagnalis]
MWRWFSWLREARRIRWCLATDRWYVSVDNLHVATEPGFDGAIRAAKAKAKAKAKVDQWERAPFERALRRRRTA